MRLLQTSEETDTEPSPAELLVHHRKQVGWGQAELARRLETSSRSVRYWETGASLPRPDILRRLVELYAAASGFTPGQESEEIGALWQRVKETFDAVPGRFQTYPVIDEAWLERVTSTTDGRRAGAGQATDAPPDSVSRPSRKASGRPAATKNNLPLLPQELVPRTVEVKAVGQALETTRLLTLTGAGGVGKTVLMHLTARAVGTAYPDGVYRVDLEPLTDLRQVLRHLASALGLTELAAEGSRDAVCALLRDRRRVLVLLDNCEHLIEATVALADDLLRTCPGVSILATSREPLRTVGEAVWRVPSLPVPPVPAVDTPAPAPTAAYAAVQLFALRARAARADFALDERNAAAVAEVCRRLDGIPLAIELAAARVETLTPQQIAARLRVGFPLRLLGDGLRGGPARHQTLGASIAWSYLLLSPEEQRLWRRLSIFEGAFTLEAAEAVGSDAVPTGAPGESAALMEEVDTLLDSLVRKSLVMTAESRAPTTAVAEAADHMRYRLLAMFRQFGREQLAESGEDRLMQARHMIYAASLPRGPDAPPLLSIEPHDWNEEGAAGTETAPQGAGH
jgi:predicted ATPase/transcriptional regulator with XRE-family HTH domain